MEQVPKKIAAGISLTMDKAYEGDDCLVGSVFELIPVRRFCLDQLSSPTDEFLEFLLRFVLHFLGFELPFRGELCEDFCIKFVGFCKDSITLCKVPYPCGIDDSEEYICIGESDDKVFFVASGCFAEDEFWRIVFEP